MFTRSEFVFTARVGPLYAGDSIVFMSVGEFTASTEQVKSPRMAPTSKLYIIYIHLELMFTRSEFMFTACVGPLGVMGIASRHGNEFTESTEPPTAPKMPSSSKFHIQYVEIPNLCLHDLNLCLQHAWGHHG